MFFLIKTCFSDHDIFFIYKTMLLIKKKTWFLKNIKNTNKKMKFLLNEYFIYFLYLNNLNSYKYLV
jgi:hypothetical protein